MSVIKCGNFPPCEGCRGTGFVAKQAMSASHSDADVMTRLMESTQVSVLTIWYC